MRQRMIADHMPRIARLLHKRARLGVTQLFANHKNIAGMRRRASTSNTPGVASGSGPLSKLRQISIGGLVADGIGQRADALNR